MLSPEWRRRAWPCDGRSAARRTQGAGVARRQEASADEAELARSTAAIEQATAAMVAAVSQRRAGVVEPFLRMRVTVLPAHVPGRGHRMSGRGHVRSGEGRGPAGAVSFGRPTVAEAD